MPVRTLISAAMTKTSLLLLLLLLVTGSRGRPIIKNEEEEGDGGNHDMKMTKAMMYLMRYGYMDHLSTSSGGSGGPEFGEETRSANLVSPSSVSESIREFQRFAGLNQTGLMNAETERMMSMPRCGVKDVGIGSSSSGGGRKREEEGERNKSRRKRYALQGSRWRVKDLTYKISSYPTTDRLTKEEVDSEVAKALSVWSDFTDLSFTQKSSGRVHIDVRFEKKEHGDGDPFDGQGGTLAHAFFPVFGGDAHFDDDEFWTKGTFVGTNLLQTASHEFGHSLGLSHSDTSSALMAPFYRGFQQKVTLDKDDIEGIQELYGLKADETRPSSSSSTKAPEKEEEEDRDDEELCNDASIDAIVTAKDGTTYTFKGKNYWKLTEESIAKGFPRSISKDWGGLPGDLDAAFTWTNGKTYFFKGSKYWRFTNMALDDDYPKEISTGFDGIPNNVDAAFVWSGNEKIYFFKGSKYYKFDPEKKPPVSSAYPKPISNWEGIPNNIDDALKYSNGYTYFFKGGQYWRFDDTKFKVDKAEPEFPRPAGFWWFGCSSVNQGRVSSMTTAKTTTTTTTKIESGDGGSWLWKWMRDRADVPVSVDEEYEVVVDDKGEKRGDREGRRETTTTTPSSVWRRVKNVFKKILGA